MDDELRMECRPAHMLPPGFVWVMWTDGTGYLSCPDGTTFFEYDQNPYYEKGIIVYKAFAAGTEKFFKGAFDEYKAFAEQQMLARLKK